MPLRLVDTEPDESRLISFSIYFDPESQKPWELNNEGNPVGEGFETITVHLALLPSHIINQISDEVFAYKKDGTSVLRAGLSVERKLVASIKKWEGVVDYNENETKPSLKTIRLLPYWVQRKIVNEINEINSLTEDEQLGLEMP